MERGEAFTWFRRHFVTAAAGCGGSVIIIIKRGGIQHDIQHGEGANQNGIYGLGGEWNTLNVFGVLMSFFSGPTHGPFYS